MQIVNQAGKGNWNPAFSQSIEIYLTGSTGSATITGYGDNVGEMRGSINGSPTVTDDVIPQLYGTVNFEKAGDYVVVMVRDKADTVDAWIMLGQASVNSNGQ